MNHRRFEKTKLQVFLDWQTHVMLERTFGYGTM